LKFFSFSGCQDNISVINKSFLSVFVCLIRGNYSFCGVDSQEKGEIKAKKVILKFTISLWFERFGHFLLQLR
jgi:hypothetical protein